MLALGCSNDQNMLGNVAFMVNRGESGFDIYPKLFAKLQCCHVRPPLWRSMNTDDGKGENASLSS